MVRKKEQERLRELLTEAVTVLCRGSLVYRRDFSIEGLLGITLDNEEIFLVNINEYVNKGDESPSQSPSDQGKLFEVCEIFYPVENTLFLICISYLYETPRTKRERKKHDPIPQCPTMLPCDWSRTFCPLLPQSLVITSICSMSNPQTSLAYHHVLMILCRMPAY